MNDKYVKNKTELARIRAENLKGVKTSLQIQGSGKLNREGFPELPPDQRIVTQWPVLDLGVDPKVDTNNWHLQVSGLCERPFELNYEQLIKLPQTKDISDFHCVTGWSRLQISWQGVQLLEIAKQAKISNKTKYVYFESYDGYSTNITLEEALKPDVLIVYEADSKPLPKEHGGPVRVITPQLWAWKGAKWVQKIEFLEKDRRGFWEVRGYSNSAIPWLNDRYTADEQED